MKDVKYPTIVILIDSFSYSYLSLGVTPFLSSLAKKYFSSKIEPMFAYRGIETTIFTGISIKNHNIWTDYHLTIKKRTIKEKTKFKLLKGIIKITDAIPYNFFSRATRYIISKYVDEGFMPNKIPYKMLDYFEKSQRSILNPYSLPFITLFDIFRENNVNFKFLAPPKEDIDKKIFKKTIELANTAEFEFLYLKFGYLDQIGHDNGPCSDKLKEELKEVDSYINNIYKTIQSNYSKFNFILMSDHGMTKIKKKVNIIDKLEEIEYKYPQDFLFFIDSTMIRFWFNDNAAKKAVMDLMSTITDGYFLDKEKLRENGLENLGSHYGEKIFVLEEGCVFFPDFFRNDIAPKGMHGYVSESNSPFLIINLPKENINEKNVVFEDIMPTVLNLMEIEIPESIQGSSLIKSKSGLN